MTTEARRHVLIWVAPEFLRSSGMTQLFREAGIFFPPENELEEYIQAAGQAGGFALTGKLVEANHGAGIWISPVNLTGLELMVPWQYVKSVITAETPQSSKIPGFMTDSTQSNPTSKKQERKGSRNSSK